jgi:hypothetical protein
LWKLAEVSQRELQIVGGFGFGEDVACHAATVGTPVMAGGDSRVSAGNPLCRCVSTLVIFGAI